MLNELTPQGDTSSNPRPSSAEGLVLSSSVVAQASSDQALRPEILEIGRSFMDLYDQALKQLAHEYGPPLL